MDNRTALLKSYQILLPYSERQKWEFHNNLVHLNYLTRFLSKEMRILDVGCGIGILALALKLLGYNLEGIDKFTFIKGNDFYAENVDTLKKIWDKNNLKILDGDVLTDKIEKTYDFIITIATIEHQKNLKLFLEKIIENTNTSSLIYIATPNVANCLNRVRFLFGKSPLLHNIKEYFNSGELFTGHWREYTLAEMKLFCLWLNLEIVEAKHLQCISPFVNKKDFRSLYLSFFRLLAYLLPSGRDTNIILARKR